MVYRVITFQKIGHTGFIRLKDEANNHDGMTRLVDELLDVSLAITSDDDIWVVITGVGENQSLQERDTAADTLKMAEMTEIGRFSVSEPIARIEKPVIAAINGNAIGWGLELILACDIRVASEESRFGLPQVEDGLMPWNGGTQRLARLVGKGKALELILTGTTINAREAYGIGLINKVVSGLDLEQAVMNMAQEMSKKGPIALRYAKEAVNAGMDLTLEQGLHLEADLYMLLHTTRDRTEGIRAFQGKRKPQFRGR